MRIAVPVSQGLIANHPGHCDHFLIADVSGGQVATLAELANPGHGPGGPPPVLLKRRGVTHVLAWGMPVHARAIFAELGFEVVLGATGDPRRALEAWLAGTLEPTDEGLDAGGAC